jgi:uncharacterized protein YbgA (DUF1722 family)/uncharacterized protein YbbK (DUF523 family)
LTVPGPAPAGDRIRVGISSCLLGTPVRYDGQHKRNAFLVAELGPLVEWVPVCPEVEVGMGVPRESVRLVRAPRGRSLMLGNQNGDDWTARMEAFAERRAGKLERLELGAYVLKSRSPSCGMERVNLFPDRDKASQPLHEGVGLFAAELLRRFPNLPIEEEGRLADPRLRENFIERLFAYDRLRRLWRARWTLRDLVAFHTAHKMALLAHSTEGYRELGRLVAGAKSNPRADLRERYETRFMSVLRKLATPGRQANVLQHMAGHLRNRLDAGDRQELAAAIDDHRNGLVPLIVPVILLRHHARRLEVAYLLGQTYLDPHPKELMLRNRV